MTRPGDVIAGGSDPLDIPYIYRVYTCYILNIQYICIVYMMYIQRINNVVYTMNMHGIP